ncbi:hypothetical protein HDU98_006139 [Podochytrium sp. JEL0797]|nr:hypothetical protein HDU98_006139 [Podochytrium sp. JEL0797]
MNVAKGAVRSVKNYTKGYSDIQIKVREATSNDPAPSSQSIMADIARCTHNHRDFIEIMEMIDKRLNDSGKNWRHVYKSLVLLDFLLVSGSENVIKYAKENLYVIKTLKEFMYLDEDGRDHGANVRQLSKDITAHLSDDARLREERAGRTRNHRFSGSDDEDRARSRDRSNTAPRTTGYGGSNEDDELRRALEESKRTAEAEERRRADKNKTDSDLKKALELNDRESQQQAPVQTEIIDFFAPVQTAQPNMFESIQANPFGGFGQQDPYAAQMEQQRMQQQMMLQQQQQQQQQQEQARQAALQQEHARQAALQQQQLLMQQQQQQNQLMSGFAAYDAQAATKNVAADPFFDVARNSSQIDPFANLAVSRGSMSAMGVSTVRSGTMGGAPSNPFGSSGATTTSPFGTSNNANNAFNSNFAPSPAAKPTNPVFTNIHQSNNNAFSSAPSTGVKNPFGLASQPSPFGTMGIPAQQQPVTSQRDFADLSPFGRSNSVSQQPIGMMGGGGGGGGAFGSMGQPQGQQQMFGSSQQQQPFGQQSNAFGQQQQQPQQNVFGSANNNAFGSQFGGGGQATPFGGQPQQQQMNAFGGQPQQQQGQQPFGANAFGQPQQPQQQQFNAFGQQGQGQQGNQQQNSFF